MGDTVLHKIFGKGIVLSATKMGPDVLYEVAFDTVASWIAYRLTGEYIEKEVFQLENEFNVICGYTDPVHFFGQEVPVVKASKII